MKRNAILLGSALVALCVVGLASINVTTAPDNRTYVWYGELVSLDQSTRTMTVKASVRDAVTGYVGQFKAGDKTVMVWDLLLTLEADTVLYVAKYDVMKAAKVDVGYILPAEFVSADAAGKTITFKTQAPDSLKAARPGQWLKVTTPMSQPADTAALTSAEASTAGRPQLKPRPTSLPEVAKVASTEDYAKAMKTIAGAFGAANKAVGSGAAADAKMQFATARAAMMGVQAFWVSKMKDDPAAIAKDADLAEAGQ